MPRSKMTLGEVIVSSEARTLLSGEEICQALAKHQPKNGVSTFSSKSGYEVVVVTKDERTRVMVSRSSMSHL
jgi:hypothetical protein